MKRLIALAALALVIGCSTDGGPTDLGPNPFLTVEEEGKEDTGYLNVRGVEIHTTIEADIQASDYQIFNAPAELAQFAVTYLREKENFYLEILAEDATAADRVEWLVNDEWLTREQAEAVERSLLTHFRMQEVNSVVLNSDAESIAAGTVYNARVPIKPFSIMTDAGDTCADYNSHISLSQSVYWYLWNPDHSGCSPDLVQNMTVTVTEVLPRNPESYPEYDRLWEDKQLDVVVLFGKLDDGDVEDDYNWRNVTALSEWLTEAGFAEAESAPMGRRFSRTAGELTEVVDIYGPDIFHSVADYARFSNWQKAVSEHEVVMYNGHSVLGTGYAFEEVVYPDFYQIFQVASCLSYEYYVRPVLAGKGGWENVEVISNVEPTYYHENLPLVSTLLAKLFHGFENEGRTSWQDIMEAVSRRLGHSRFGVSGARGNCFSPEGDRCEPGPDPEGQRHENTTPTAIPDNSPSGAVSVIDVAEPAVIGALSVDVDITHTYVGDLKVVLTHNGTEAVLWNREGGSDDDIQQTFKPEDFTGMDAAGTWTLHVVDEASIDTGALNSWAIVITPAA
jgi:hypothetical protein